MSSALNVLQTSHAFGDVLIVSKAAEVTKVRISSKYQTLFFCILFQLELLNRAQVIGFISFF